MTIGKRLIAGFAATVLVAAALGGFAYTRLASIGAHADKIVSDCLPGTYLSGQIPVITRQNYGRFLRHLMSPDADGMKAIEAEMKQDSADLTKLYDEYEAVVWSDADKALLEKTLAARKVYTDYRKEALALSQAGKKAEALALTEARVEPALDVYTTTCRAMNCSLPMRAASVGAK